MKVLGCDGGIGSERRTTSFLVNKHTLIDAGTGCGELSLDELINIDQIFLTHSHLDHILFLPLIADTVKTYKQKPIQVYGLHETLLSLKKFIFNWSIWPDFTKIPSPENPCLKFNEIVLGDIVNLDEFQIEALPACHVVPAVGYAIHTHNGSLAFSGDTEFHTLFIERINEFSQLKKIILEGSYGNEKHQLAQISGHQTPGMINLIIDKVNPNIEIFISHLKPYENIAIERELNLERVKILKKNMILEI